MEAFTASTATDIQFAIICGPTLAVYSSLNLVDNPWVAIYNSTCRWKRNYTKLIPNLSTQSDCAIACNADDCAIACNAVELDLLHESVMWQKLQLGHHKSSCLLVLGPS